jgi:hypothetical protein
VIDPETERDCFALLDRFMAALNAGDAAAMDACMHFPSIRLAEGRMAIYEAPGQNPMDLFERLRREDGWSHSRWDDRVVVQAGPNKAHVKVAYSRFRADGSLIGAYESLYILTKDESGWGIAVRSSFGP